MWKFKQVSLYYSGYQHPWKADTNMNDKLNTVNEMLKKLESHQNGERSIGEQIQYGIPGLTSNETNCPRLSALNELEEAQQIVSCDTYDTTINQASQCPLNIGPIFQGVEEHCTKPIKIDIKGHYNTKVHIDHHHGPILQLDPQATEDILARNPDLFIRSMDTDGMPSIKKKRKNKSNVMKISKLFRKRRGEYHLDCNDKSRNKSVELNVIEMKEDMPRNPSDLLGRSRQSVITLLS